MQVLTVRNVNSAWHRGVALLHHEGVPESSRGGDVLVLPEPVTTVYKRPWERVLFCPSRDGNCFFHLMESMWMLAGESDARWLDQFVHDFSSRFAEKSGFMHGAYGKRWRGNFLHDSKGAVTRDQLTTISRMLREDPTTRRAVLTMWDPNRDLGRSMRDHPCNTQCYFRGRRMDVVGEADAYTLDMMVTCRSNDIVWGAYGANAVHMSVLHEYMAAMAGMRQGRMWQMSWNYHAYTEVFDKIVRRGVGPCRYYEEGVTVHSPLFDPASVGEVYDELDNWMSSPTNYSSASNPQLFDNLLVPMMRVHDTYQRGELGIALSWCQQIRHADWRLAAEEWIDRRAERRRERELGRNEGSEGSGAGAEVPHVAGPAAADDGGAPVAGVPDTGGDTPAGIS